MANEPIEQTEPLPESEPPQPSPNVAEIHHAYDYGDYLVLVVVIPGETGESVYVLYPDDPHGLAPGLRAQLERMVSDGEIVIEPAPPLPEPLPEPVPQQQTPKPPA